MATPLWTGYPIVPQGSGTTLIAVQHNIDWKNRKAVQGIFIGEKEYWGRGYGSDAIRALLGFAFREMNLHRVYLSVYDYNERAIRCYEKCGFRHEGRLRKARFSDGRYHDELMMGILREEFEELNGNG